MKKIISILYFIEKLFQAINSQFYVHLLEVSSILQEYGLVHTDSPFALFPTPEPQKAPPRLSSLDRLSWNGPARDGLDL